MLQMQIICSQCSLLGYYNMMWPGSWVSVFWRTVQPLCSLQNINHEDRGSVFIRNFDTHIPDCNTEL